MTQLPSALACHLSSVASSEVSAANVPPNGISMWGCTSMPPGSTYRPAASSTRSAADAHALASSVPGAASPVIRSPSTSTSAATPPLAVTTVPPLITMRICYGLPFNSRLNQRAVLVRTPVAVELPQVPDLLKHAHVQVADQHRVLRVGCGLTDQLAARIREVGLAVELVVAQRLHADPVDRADVVLVGDRGRGLLQPPQVLGQAPAGGRGVEHDPGTGQAERAPALGA